MISEKLTTIKIDPVEFKNKLKNFSSNEIEPVILLDQVPLLDGNGSLSQNRAGYFCKNLSTDCYIIYEIEIISSEYQPSVYCKGFKRREDHFLRCFGVGWGKLDHPSYYYTLNQEVYFPYLLGPPEHYYEINRGGRKVEENFLRNDLDLACYWREKIGPFNGRIPNYNVDINYIGEEVENIFLRRLEKKSSLHRVRPDEVHEFVMKVGSHSISDKTSCFLSIIKSLEGSLDIEVERKDELARVIVLELSRIISHLDFLEKIFKALHVEIAQSEISQIKLALSRYFFTTFREDNFFSLRRFNNFFAKKDISPLIDILFSLDTLLKSVNSLVNHRARFLIQMTRECFSPSLFEFPLQGPNRRSFGHNIDIRSSTYGEKSYRDFDLDIVKGIKGTLYERFLVRLEEIRESIRLIGCAFHNLPVLKTEKNLVVDHISYLENIESCWHYTPIEGSEGEVGVLFKKMQSGDFVFYIPDTSWSTEAFIEYAAPGTLKEEINLFLSSFGPR